MKVAVRWKFVEDEMDEAIVNDTKRKTVRLGQKKTVKPTLAK